MRRRSLAALVLAAAVMVALTACIPWPLPSRSSTPRDLPSPTIEIPPPIR